MDTEKSHHEAYKHVIWDWNGTLLNDRWLWVEAMNEVLRRRGMTPITEKQYQANFRFPFRDYYLQLGFDLKKDAFEKLALEFIEFYRSRWQECALQDETRPVLEALAGHGLSHSVLSAIEHEFLLQMVMFHDLSSFFTALLGISDHQAASKMENGKHHLQSLHVSPETIIFVGDTIHDFEVATHIGVDCLLVAHGHNSRNKLEASGAKVVGSMREVQEALIENR
ncbi:HAD family hydrolase [bacterium]|nr:HAD family hydrolase [bacterium]